MSKSQSDALASKVNGRRVGLYPRIARGKDAREQGIERQGADCRALAERLGWDVTATHFDSGKVKRRLAVCGAVLVVAGTVSACSSPEPEAEEGASGPSMEGCEVAPMRVLRALAQGANDFPIKPVEGAAFMTDAGNYMVAMEFDFKNEDIGTGERGVWLATDLSGDGPFMAVDGIAAEFTVWPNTYEGQEFDITMDGAQEALDCLS